jgi:preprotein translocase subunit SecA
VEYQREGYEMFNSMMDAIKEESVGFIFNLEVQIEVEEEQVDGFPVDEDADGDAMADSADGSDGDTVVDEPHEAPPHITAKGLTAAPPRQLTYTAPSEDGEAETSTEAQRQPAAAAQGPAGGRRPQRGTGNRGGSGNRGPSKNKSRKRR